MNVGTSTCCRMGYIMQNPTDSRKERASSNVRTPRPSRRHFSRRNRSNSIIKVLDHTTEIDLISAAACLVPTVSSGGSGVARERLPTKDLCTSLRRSIFLRNKSDSLQTSF